MGLFGKKVEEKARECYDSPECRKRVLEIVKEELEDALDKIVVEALKRASERPPIWWQWLILFGFGALAGMGVGLALSRFVMPTPTPEVTVVSPP